MTPTLKAYKARVADLLATARATGQYACVSCEVLWPSGDVTDEHVELEGCPDCLHRCDRCGSLKDHWGSIEHCL
jgi:hypothetical protein